MSVKLVIGKLQERLVQKFTRIEVVTLTAWLYLALLGLYLIILGIFSPSLVYLGAGGVLTLGAILILDLGLHREHDVATESGNAGPDAQ